jgi:hypothetical protein
MSVDLTTLTDTSSYITWIKAEFAPLTLITPDATIAQCVNSAVRYWNVSSSYRMGAMIPYTGATSIEIPAEFKNVFQVYPNNANLTLFGGLQSLWALAGVAILDNVTTDLIYLGEALKNYKSYLSLGFDWTYEMNKEDPEGKGSLYVRNVGAGTSAFFVVGSRRILKADQIKDQYILDFLLRYTKALVKQVEGSSIRKANMIVQGLDGQSLVDEGIQEMKDLQNELRINGRWVLMARRSS